MNDPTLEPDTTTPTTTATTNMTDPRRRRRRKRRGGHMHDHHDHHIHHAEHGRGGGRHRARRGAVRAAILTLLDERPMHGYEIITELETRSEGRWRPSPGAIYPALEKMEAHGAITSEELDDKRQYSLTTRGRAMLAELRDAADDGAPEPWNQSGTGGRGELRRLTSELAGQIRQIARFGSGDQRTAATAVLEDTKRRLYAIMATEPSDEGTDTTDSSSDATDSSSHASDSSSHASDTNFDTTVETPDTTG